MINNKEKKYENMTPLEALEFIEQALKGAIKKETKVQIYKCIEIIKEGLTKGEKQ